jgi:hypothetical protein
LGYDHAPDGAAAKFLADLDRHTTQTRAMFLHLLEREKQALAPSRS